jgi:excisionase family DNA binding protein
MPTTRQTDSPVCNGPKAAEYLAISLRTLRALAADGRLPYVQLSKLRVGFLLSDLDAYLRRNRR